MDKKANNMAAAMVARLRMNQQATPKALVTMSSDGGTAYLDVGSEIVEDEVREFWGYGISAGAVRESLRGLDVPRLEVQINSPGGSVFAGQAIYENIRDFANRTGATVDVKVYGLAASIASVIMLAGDTRTIGQGSFVMVHKPWSMAMGEAGDLRSMADLLDSVEGVIAGLYAARTNIDAETATEWMAAETWMTPEQALSAGFATDIHEAKGAGAAAKYAGYAQAFRHMPEQITECPLAKGREEVFDGMARVRLENMRLQVL